MRRPALPARAAPALLAAGTLLLLLLVLSPLVMLFVASLKGHRHDILADMGSWRAFWVSEPTLDNYREIFGLSGSLPFGRYFLNSVVILAVTVGLGLVVNSLAAFVLAWGRIPGRRLILAVLLAFYIVPQESVVMPLLYMVSRMGLTDTFAAQILPFVGSPLFVFMFYQFFVQIPKELVEAAAIDGAGPFRIWYSVFLPLSAPVIATVAVLLGLDMWNQYLWPLMVTRSDAVKPISVAVAGFFGTDEIYWDQAMAASVLMTLPIVLLYLFVQRWFISSFISSAVKG